MTQPREMVERQVYDPNKGTYRTLRYPKGMNARELQQWATPPAPPTGPLTMPKHIPRFHYLTGEPLE